MSRHPAWCVQDQPSGIGRHVSDEIRVGRRRPGHLGDRGEVSARLTAAGDGPAWVSVNAAHMVGVTVDLDLEDARRLRDGLTRLLRQVADGG